MADAEVRPVEISYCHPVLPPDEDLTNLLGAAYRLVMRIGHDEPRPGIASGMPPIDDREVAARDESGSPRSWRDRPPLL